MRFFAISVLIFIGTLALGSGAQAACAALPYSFSNGQLADASQVMGNFNALRTCILDDGIVDSGTAGQIGTYNATGNTISGAPLSSVLDAAVGSTQGSILYRGASGWTALAPGTAGQILRSGGAGANPSWISQSAGVTSPFFFNLSPSAASAFTQSTQTGITATLTDMASGRGPVLNITGSGSNSNASMEQAVLSQTAFTVTACIFLASSLSDNWFVGIGVQDNTGKYDSFGWRNYGSSGTFSKFEFASIQSVYDYSNIYGNFNINGPLWLRLQLTGGNFVFSASFDGENYETVETVSATNYLGSTLTTVGIIADDNSSHSLIIDNLSWSQTTP